jgi:hypothetical protein
MAILDRPMFQRPLTKDELRRYGLPAFANGGIVYMNQGGGVPGLQNKNTTPAPSKPDISLTPIGTVISKEIIERDGKKIEVTETVVPGARGQKIIQKSEKVLFTPGSTTTVKGQEITTPAQGEDVEVGEVEIEEKETTPPPAEDAPTVEPPASTTDDPSAPKERERRDTLAELVKERSDLYKQLLGDPKEMMKQQGFLQLAQFGLNLASARGGNLAEKIAKSAKDPLQAFAQLAQQAARDERAIDVAAIEAGEAELAQIRKREEEMGNLEQQAKYLVETGVMPNEKAAVEYIYEAQQGATGKTATELFTSGYNAAAGLATGGKQIAAGAIAAGGQVPKGNLLNAPLTDDGKVDFGALDPNVLYVDPDDQVFLKPEAKSDKIIEYNFTVF